MILLEIRYVAAISDWLYTYLYGMRAVRVSGIGWDAGLGGDQVWRATHESVSECFIRLVFSNFYKSTKTPIKGPYDSGFGLNMRS